MSYWQACLLGLVQGVGEFLPISSSGHLYLAKFFLGIQDEIPLSVDVALHFATLMAVFIVFRKKLLLLCQALLRFCLRKSKPDDGPLLSMCFVIFFATLITGGSGYLIQKISVPIIIVIAGFFYTATLLIVLHFLPAHKVWHPWPQILTLGIFQSIAVLPGISRSGSTIFAAILTGHKREEAGEYSFILSIPIILAAFVFNLKDLNSVLDTVQPGPILLAMIVAFISGILALYFLLRLIAKARLWYFSLYLIPLASFILYKVLHG